MQELRRTNPQAKLTTALLAVAEDHGFSSWRALKAKLDRRRQTHAARFFEACATGDADALRRLLRNEPDLSRASNPEAHHEGWTGLHEAALGGHPDAARLLLDHGADPNARETRDNTSPLHWAAARRSLEIVRALLDAGADVNGRGGARARRDWLGDLLPRAR